MPEFRIFETAEFLARLKRLEPARREFLERKIREYVYPRLRQEPYYGPQIRKLRGYSPDTWRYRIGDYRLFYSRDSKERIVYLLTIDDRKDAYR
ncbi:type II toxin-antitoxin system RelE/ParE family toxin [candidate division TA06 bacterium]|uniref:Type II toxin-antitoxin system RelE/ParE family toxin n=1 Tax=candidate division TA06 bacterium TaxID=2250710 RepID=A0A933I8W7_UNCT6|nr:type II toxin-antitoxin system RelE/ParE family toxin [candidate division TA06 bacterium]